MDTTFYLHTTPPITGNIVHVTAMLGTKTDGVYKVTGPETDCTMLVRDGRVHHYSGKLRGIRCNHESPEECLAFHETLSGKIKRTGRGHGRGKKTRGATPPSEAGDPPATTANKT